MEVLASSVEPGSQGPGDTINLLEICQFVLQAQGYKVISLDTLSQILQCLEENT